MMEPAYSKDIAETGPVVSIDASKGSVVGSKMACSKKESSKRLETVDIEPVILRHSCISLFSALMMSFLELMLCSLSSLLQK